MFYSYSGWYGSHNVNPVADVTIFKSVVRLQLTSDIYSRQEGGWPLSTVLQILGHCQNTVEEVKVYVLVPSRNGENGILSIEPIHLLRLRRLEYVDKGDQNIPSNLLQYIYAQHVLTLHVASAISQHSQGSLQVLPPTFTQLSQRNPVFLEVYRPNSEWHLGLNLYADPEKRKKLFAFRFILLYFRQRDLENIQSELLLSTAEQHSLLSIEYLRIANSINIAGPLRSFVEKHPGFKRTDIVDEEPRTPPYY